jgi:hypothetical protein
MVQTEAHVIHLILLKNLIIHYSNIDIQIKKASGEKNKYLFT